MIPQYVPSNPGFETSERRLFPHLRRHGLSSGTQIALDVTVLYGAFVLAYLLRFDFEIPQRELRYLFVQAPFVLALQLTALTVFGARSPMWRYTGVGHIKSFLYGTITPLIIISLMRLEVSASYQVCKIPLSVNLFDGVLAFVGTFGLRVLRRTSYERRLKRGRLVGPAHEHPHTKSNFNVHPDTKRAVLLIGAGQAGVLAAKEIDSRADLGLDIKGFVDDDRKKFGRSVIRGRKVLGATDDLPRLVHSLKIDHVIITIAEASRAQIHHIVKICEGIPVRVRTIPGLYELIDGRVEISRIRDVQIEDLLGREPVRLDMNSLSRELSGKTVMVTGAGGSIGSELARQVLRFAPVNLILVERAEFALFEIDQELRRANPSLSIIPQVVDIGDEVKMRFLFDHYRPQVVIHSAAHKHVPLMESNPFEAIKNNVLSTRLLAELAGEFKSEVFVMISTDKAVRPTSIMGASKRVAELVVQSLNKKYETRYVAVRFGNVIGSAGSVIPIFREQIRRGGPITITDKRMKRYFMTIPEAAQLVLQAGAIGKGGEVFILQMGEAVCIMDLAETLITLSGLKPHEDIKILEVGIRPGEKLYEELQFETEDTVPTTHPKIFINRLSTLQSEAVETAVRTLADLVRVRDETTLRRFLNRLLPEANLTELHLQPVEPSRLNALAKSAAYAGNVARAAASDPGIPAISLT